VVFVPIILYTWYIQQCELWPYIELGFDVPFFGDKIGGGFYLNFIVSSAYFFVDWQVASAVVLWWWPVMLIGNVKWLAHGDELYFGMT